MLPLSFVGMPVEMSKHRWRELVEALFESHFDPRKDEQLKQSKLDIENKLPKILKLVRERRQNRKNRNAEANAWKDSELIELIEDFHKQYQFVYDLYDNLRDQLSRTINNNKEEEGYYTATSSSDSESDSENEVNTADAHMKEGPRNKGFGKLAQEKESIHFDRMEKMKKVQENSKTVGKFEEKSRALQEQLKNKEQELSRLARMHTLRQEEASGLMKELKLELASFNIKLNAMCKEKRPVEVKTENKGLQARVEILEKNAKKMDEDFGNGDDKVEGGFLSEVSTIKELVVQVNQLKQNVDYLSMKKADSIASTSHENLLDQVNKMKDDLGTLRKKNSDLEWRMKKISRENSDLLSQIDSCKREYQSKAHRMQKEKEDAQVRLKNLESEVQHVSTQRNEVESQLLTKDQESVELKHESERLQEKAISLEKMLKERDDQLCALQRKFDSGENDDKPVQMVSRISQINNLEHDLGSKNEFEKRLKTKNQELIKLTSEREFLQRRVRELENKLKDKGDELSKLSNEMSVQIAALTRQVNQLQEDTDIKKKLEDQSSCQEKEITQLVDEKQSLQAKILELEITLTEKEDEIASLQRRVQIGENEASARVYGLTSQINYFQEALSGERKKSLEKLTHMENQNSELTSKLSNQQAIIKQQEDIINKLHEDCKLVKGRFVQAADRKMDEVAHEFRKNFEDKFRMLSQRIRVAEQLHAEDKDSLKKIKKRCEELHPGIERKLKDLMSSSKADLLKLSQAVDEMMKGMEHFISDFDSKEGSFLQRLSRVSDDVQVVKNWVRWTMDEMKPWKNNEPSSGSPFAPVDDKEQEKVMKEKVKRLEVKVNKEKSEKLRLVKGMYDCQRKIADLERTIVDKDEGLSRLSKEKVEAIRQLCMWIEYHRSRFDHFKKMMLAKTVKRRGR